MSGNGGKECDGVWSVVNVHYRNLGVFFLCVTCRYLYMEPVSVCNLQIS